MSKDKEVNRYKVEFGRSVKSKNGPYVFYSDYQSLQSERDSLKFVCEEYKLCLEDSTKSIESMLHHNKVLTDELSKTVEELYPITVDKDTIGYNFHIQYVTALREAYTKGCESLQPLHDRIKELEKEVVDYKEVLADKRRLTKEIDVLINKDNSAENPSLCDVFKSIKLLVNELDRLKLYNERK